jgi:hypothetical protein
LPASAYQKKHHRWVAQAMRGMHDPGSLRYFHVTDWMRLTLSMILKPGRWTTASKAFFNSKARGQLLEGVKRQIRRLS